jgi:ketosteroid isomerase-like protein
MSTTTLHPTDVATRWVHALVAGDRDAFEALLAEDVRFRELNPGGLETLDGRAAAQAAIEPFAELGATLERCDAHAAGHRAQVTYAFSGGGARFEIHAFCDVHDGRVTAVDQLCSGRI